jgi:cleavage stimulation factor subunit 3
MSIPQWLAKNIANRGDKSVVLTGGATLDKGDIRVGSNKKSFPQSSKVVRPEISRMVIYDPRQMKGIQISVLNISIFHICPRFPW